MREFQHCIDLRAMAGYNRELGRIARALNLRHPRIAYPSPPSMLWHNVKVSWWLVCSAPAAGRLVL